MSKRKQSAIDLETKLQILAEIDKRESCKTDVAKKYGIAKSTVSTIIANREKICQAAEEGFFTSKAKRLRPAQHAGVEIELVEWFLSLQDTKAYINGPLIQEKARSIAADLGIKNFKCSQGWLGRFKTRYQIALTKSSSNLNSKLKKITVSEPLLEIYQSKNVFYLNETGLFFNLHPKRTPHLKKEKCVDGFMSKERLTAIFCCNADGTEKLRPWVIGGVKNLDQVNLSCDYSYHPKAWIDAKAFKKWILKLNSQMSQLNRRILIKLRCCGTYKVEDLDLTHIELHFVPQTSPEQNLIRQFKQNYRLQFVRSLVGDVQKEKKWDILEAMKAIGLAWDDISEKNIKTDFQRMSKAGKVEKILENPEWDRLRLLQEMVNANIKIYSGVTLKMVFLPF